MPMKFLLLVCVCIVRLMFGKVELGHSWFKVIVDGIRMSHSFQGRIDKIFGTEGSSLNFQQWNASLSFMLMCLAKWNKWDVNFRPSSAEILRGAVSITIVWGATVWASPSSASKSHAVWVILSSRFLLDLSDYSTSHAILSPSKH